MEIRLLRYFVAVAQSGSVSAAAKQMHVAQPSLSQHVKRIEEELGAELLVRSARGVALTDQGLRFLAHARDIVSRFDLAVADMQRDSDDRRGQVSLGLPSITSHALAVPLIETIRHEFPEITLRVVEAMSGHVERWLSDGTVDIALLFDTKELRHLRAKPMVVEPLFLIAARDNWPQTGPTVDHEHCTIRFKDCARLELILSSRHHGLRETIERLARTVSITLSVPLEVDSLSQMKRLVARGSGYTILPNIAVAEDLAAGTLVAVPISDPPLFNTTFLAIDPRRPQTRAAECVAEMVRKVVRELVISKRWPGELLDR